VAHADVRSIFGEQPNFLLLDRLALLVGTIPEATSAILVSLIALLLVYFVGNDSARISGCC
jgi:hypothetical protein